MTVSLSPGTQWLCCQLGAREHFAVARGLHRRGSLAALITDAWAPPGSQWSMLPGETGRRLSERYSPDLAAATVRSFTGSLIAHEGWWRMRGLGGWPVVLERNRWFQTRAADAIANLAPRSSTPVAVFAHSYAALAAFRQAKSRGYATVLGQIDPGEEHLRVVQDVARRWPEFGPPLDPPPPVYFHDWREECQLADRIIVNSQWSRDLLERARIDPSKIEVVPLPFEAEGNEATFVRDYPAAFTPTRPLRALFVGSVAAFKGVPALLESLTLLEDLPVELRIVGPMAATIPGRFLNHPRVRWVGSVTRSDVMSHCRESDVLVFPSHSDGFGMAQVEAQQWRLPIIASQSCGRVVRDDVNGLLLADVSPQAIAGALRRTLDPMLLRRWSSASGGPAMTLDAFGAAITGSAQAQGR